MFHSRFSSFYQLTKDELSALDSHFIVLDVWHADVCQEDFDFLKTNLEKQRPKPASRIDAEVADDAEKESFVLFKQVMKKMGDLRKARESK